MRTIYLLSTLVLFLNMTFSAKAENLSAESMSQSPCKKAPTTFDGDGFNDGRSQFLITYENRTLTFYGKNLRENCAALLDTEASISNGREIHFRVNVELENPASCMCNYDIDASYQNIEPGRYTIYINDELYPEVELSEGSYLNLTKLSGIAAAIADRDSTISIIDDDVLKVTASGSTEVTAYDTEGRLRMKLSVEGDSEISLASLPAGIYLFMAKENDSLHTVKYLKK
ncbi:MAG: T9SS type A sorting domain-containing protein [Muribaculaceae bacterium]|nr:T9SS type A sorting domain-containing protein [Muribaculaceae bacterium]